MSGSFVVTINRAEFLNAYSYEGKRDTCCVIKLNDITVTTSTAFNGGKYPHWNEDFQLDIHSKDNRLKFEVYEVVGKNNNVFLGTGVLEFAEILKDSGHGGFWIPIKNQNNSNIGSIIVLCRRMTHAEISLKSIDDHDAIRALPKAPSKTIADTAPAKALKEKKEDVVVVQELQNVTKQTRDHFKKTKKEAKKEGTESKIKSWFGFRRKSSAKSEKSDPNSYKSLQDNKMKYEVLESSLQDDLNLEPIIPTGKEVALNLHDSQEEDSPQQNIPPRKISKGYEAALQEPSDDDENEAELYDSKRDYMDKKGMSVNIL